MAAAAGPSLSESLEDYLEAIYHIERDAPVPCGHARPEDGDLLIGRRVHDAAAALDVLADLGGGPLADAAFAGRGNQILSGGIYVA